MVGKWLMQRRRDDKGRFITPVAVGRVNCKTGQDHAQQPRDSAGPRCDGTMHCLTIKLRGPDYQQLRLRSSVWVLLGEWLPEFDAVAFGVGDPGEAAVVGVFALWIDGDVRGG